MVMRNILLATEAGLGNGETPIFPIQIFRVKEGVNYNPGDPNYDLFQLAMPVSAPSGCSPTSPFWTRPLTCSTTSPAIRRPRSPTWAAAPGSWATCTTPSREIAYGRGNLSFTSINLPRLAIKAKGDVERLLRGAGRAMMDLVRRAAAGAVRDPVPQNRCTTTPSSWARACGWTRDKLGWNDEVRRGAQARHPVRGLHRPGGDPEGPASASTTGRARRPRTLGLEIVGHMRARMDQKTPGDAG